MTPPVRHAVRSPGAPRIALRAYAGVVCYDEDLAHRIRDLLSGERGLSEKKMFGGLASLIGGTMAIAASGQGGLLVRADPAESHRLVATGSASVAVMRGGRCRAGCACRLIR